MNLHEFLKYSDKYNEFWIFAKVEYFSNRFNKWKYKIKDGYFSWNGSDGLLENDDSNLFNYELAEWKVKSYKWDGKFIKVYVELDEQLIENYNHFPEHMKSKPFGKEFN